ncbi:hypothetical protein FOA52_005937 [Chlamydomonas sp. UWO 241]|nr:hypothetical protein FOA52_005937 [Chlamydomonas sp. UWO 241]
MSSDEIMAECLIAALPAPLVSRISSDMNVCDVGAVRCACKNTATAWAHGINSVLLVAPCASWPDGPTEVFPQGLLHAVDSVCLSCDDTRLALADAMARLGHDPWAALAAQLVHAPPLRKLRLQFPKTSIMQYHNAMKHISKRIPETWCSDLATLGLPRLLPDPCQLRMLEVCVAGDRSISAPVMASLLPPAAWAGLTTLTLDQEALTASHMRLVGLALPSLQVLSLRCRCALAGVPGQQGAGAAWEEEAERAEQAGGGGRGAGGAGQPHDYYDYAGMEGGSESEEEGGEEGGGSPYYHAGVEGSSEEGAAEEGGQRSDVGAAPVAAAAAEAGCTGASTSAPSGTHASAPSPPPPPPVSAPRLQTLILYGPLLRRGLPSFLATSHNLHTMLLGGSRVIYWPCDAPGAAAYGAWPLAPGEDADREGAATRGLVPLGTLTGLRTLGFVAPRLAQEEWDALVKLTGLTELRINDWRGGSSSPGGPSPSSGLLMPGVPPESAASSGFSLRPMEDGLRTAVEDTGGAWLEADTPSVSPYMFLNEFMPPEAQDDLARTLPLEEARAWSRIPPLGRAFPRLVVLRACVERGEELAWAVAGGVEGALPADLQQLHLSFADGASRGAPQPTGARAPPPLPLPDPSTPRGTDGTNAPPGGDSPPQLPLPQLPPLGDDDWSPRAVALRLSAHLPRVCPRLVEINVLRTHRVPLLGDVVNNSGACDGSVFEGRGGVPPDGAARVAGRQAPPPGWPGWLGPASLVSRLPCLEALQFCGPLSLPMRMGIFGNLRVLALGKIATREENAPSGSDSLRLHTAQLPPGLQQLSLLNTVVVDTADEPLLDASLSGRPGLPLGLRTLQLKNCVWESHAGAGGLPARVGAEAERNARALLSAIAACPALYELRLSMRADAVSVVPREWAAVAGGCGALRHVELTIEKISVLPGSQTIAGPRDDLQLPQARVLGAALAGLCRCPALRALVLRLPGVPTGWDAWPEGVYSPPSDNVHPGGSGNDIGSGGEWLLGSRRGCGRARSGSGARAPTISSLPAWAAARALAERVFGDPREPPPDFGSGVGSGAGGSCVSGAGGARGGSRDSGAAGAAGAVAGAGSMAVQGLGLGLGLGRRARGRPGGGGAAGTAGAGRRAAKAAAGAAVPIMSAPRCLGLLSHLAHSLQSLDIEGLGPATARLLELHLTCTCPRTRFRLVVDNYTDMMNDMDQHYDDIYAMNEGDFPSDEEADPELLAELAQLMNDAVGEEEEELDLDEGGGFF